MNKYIEIFFGSFSGYASYLWQEITHPSFHNYFYWLLGLSIFIWGLEIVFPWRKNQKWIRKDFWLDAFYMFFNFFLFSLVAYNALSNIAVEAFNDFLGLFNIKNIVAIEISTWPMWLQLMTMFIIADFIQWNVHRLLHSHPTLWEFHKLHHSVKEMGFAAHLRYHWMETIIYKTIQYIPLAMIGFGIDDFFIIHVIALAIGHLNHSNINLDYGPLKYIFNSPRMHIWHHARELPKGKNGVNYAISLSIWDYFFNTAYLPHSGRDIRLGFNNDQVFPNSFSDQVLYPFKNKKLID